MPELQYKQIPFEVKEVVPVEGGGWEIAGYASTFGDPPDAYGDVVAPGAFAESIAARKTKFLYEHREPIGRQLELREDATGLFGRWSIVDTRAGTDAYKLAKAGVLDSLSIGYFTEAAEQREDGATVLTKLALYEVSAVAMPANEHAVITDVKTAQAEPPPPEPLPQPELPPDLVDPLAIDLDATRVRLLALGVDLERRP